MNHHSARLPNQTSGAAHFVPTQGHQICDWEMLDEFGWLTDICTIYSCSVILLQMVAVLAFVI